MPTTMPDGRRPISVILPSPRLKTRDRSRRYKGLHSFTPLLVLLALLSLGHFLIAFYTSSSTGSQNTPIDCNSLLQNNDYTKSVGLHADEQMGAIASVKQLDDGSPAELVQVMHSDAQHTLDVYLFGCKIYQNKPLLTTLLAQRGLVNGTVEISQAHTLITGTLDTSLAADASALLMPSQQYIYREYGWQGNAFQQVIFPGFYPVTSRAEAESLQQQADIGQSLPWSDPLVTAEAMARDILQWPTNNDSQNALLSNDGSTAQVELVQQTPPLTVYVTLAQLVQQGSKGLWFVVAAHTQGITVGLNGQNMTAQPQNTTQIMQNTVRTLVTSPIMLQGTSALADGQTSATLFDHTLAPVSSASNGTLLVKTDGTYTDTLSYTTTVSGQEGVLLIQSLPQTVNDAIEQGQVLLVPILLG